MDAPVTYLFDPFCGWCYAAAPQVARLHAALPPGTMRGIPVGLFWTNGERPMTAEFRDYAWSNDQRIAKMTGQPFSQAYYDKVLSDFSVPFDSAPPTRAIATAETLRPGSTLEMLARLQKARFVEGKQLLDGVVLADLAADIGVDAKAFAAEFASPGSLAAAQSMVEEGQAIMERLGIRGVPALTISHGDHAHPVPADVLIDPDRGLVEALAEQFSGGGAAHAHDH